MAKRRVFKSANWEYFYRSNQRLFVVLMILILIILSILSAFSSKNEVKENFTAIIIEDCDIYLNPELSVASEKLFSGDLVRILYSHSDDVCYVRRAVTEIPTTEGYISKDKLSFSFDSANQGVIASEVVYNTPDEKDVFKDKNTLGLTCIISQRVGRWAEISLPGGIDSKWIPQDKIEYSLCFDENEKKDFKYYHPIKEYLQEEYKKAYSPYYDTTIVESLVGYSEEVLDNTLEATFIMNAKFRNYYKDPDTVPYIKDAKLNADKNNVNYYKTLYKVYYEEYNAIKEGNYILKLTAKLKKNGLDKDTIELYSSDGVTNEWNLLDGGCSDYFIV